MSDGIDEFAPVRNLGAGDALEAWRWLTGKSASVALLTSMGDLFFTRSKGLLRRKAVYFLDTYEGTVEVASSNWQEFKDRVGSGDDVPGHWFKYELLIELVAEYGGLRDGEVFSPTHPPILGGSYEVSNFARTEWAVHVGLMGQIHEQIKGLPEGAPIQSVKLHGGN